MTARTGKGASRTLSRFAALGVALVTTFAVACTELGQRAVVPVREYASYRQFRVAETAETKLGSAYQYLKTYPDGVYRHEVGTYLARGSAAYVRSGWNDPARLEAFLAEVPTGAAADRAVVRLVKLAIHAERSAALERQLDERTLLITRRLAEAEEGRRALVVGVASWAKRLAAIRDWGARTSELDPDFIFRFRLTEPAARCTDTECTKPVAVSYAVPEGKTQSAREAIYDVGLRLENGGVRAAWITGPELFTRISEAVTVAAQDPSDSLARAEAIGIASQVIAVAIEPAFPAARCTVPAVSPVVLHRLCDGSELRVVSAVELGEEDRVVIAPAPVAPAPSGPAVSGVHAPSDQPISPSPGRQRAH